MEKPQKKGVWLGCAVVGLLGLVILVCGLPGWFWFTAFHEPRRAREEAVHRFVEAGRRRADGALLRMIDPTMRRSVDPARFPETVRGCTGLTTHTSYRIEASGGGFGDTAAAYLRYETPTGPLDATMLLIRDGEAWITQSYNETREGQVEVVCILPSD